MKLTFVSFMVVLGALNVNLTKNENNGNELHYKSIGLIQEANAEQGDDPVYAGWSIFFATGSFYKSEWQVQEPCPTTSSNTTGVKVCIKTNAVGACIEYEDADEQTNGAGRTDIRCTNGNENCTPIEC